MIKGSGNTWEHRWTEQQLMRQGSKTETHKGQELIKIKQEAAEDKDQDENIQTWWRRHNGMTDREHTEETGKCLNWRIIYTQIDQI